MRDLVSILIPAYNAERWIAGTIESALQQTWKAKEIIVVDDGSRDSTASIVRGFSSLGVKLVTQPNSGAAAARNRALSLAQGEYIQWLDADDLLAPNKITLQLTATESKRTRELLTGPFGTFFYCYWRARFQPTALWRNLTPIEWIKARFVNGIWMNPAVWLVSRRLTELAGPWDERLSMSGDDDGEYICRVVAAAEHVRFVPAATSYYRETDSGSLSGRRAAGAFDALLLSTRLCIDHLLSLEDSEDTRMACVRLIENRLSYFYPEKPHLLSQLEHLATALGSGQLNLKESRKYKLIGQYFGWRYAKLARNVVSSTKSSTYRGLDKLLYKMTPANRRTWTQREKSLRLGVC